jgi:ABC-type bacteriocin/lantibiotic exporter with double-glycine peptidase domain
MTALVGPSGAGKSTLSSLVPRLYDVTEGRVTLDGHDVRDLTLTSLAAAVGVVSQDAHLFHDSIESNLRYAKPDATDAELVAACTAARIHHVIERLPDGYATIVGERGYRLSGGEKQRLSIARVLLKDPAVVVLDEATAHLDTESERLVQAALKATLEGRTSLVIAHRLSTVVDADLIVVLEAGEIVERGTHRARRGRRALRRARPDPVRHHRSLTAGPSSRQPPGRHTVPGPGILDGRWARPAPPRQEAGSAGSSAAGSLGRLLRLGSSPAGSAAASRQARARTP